MPRTWTIPFARTLAATAACAALLALPAGAAAKGCPGAGLMAQDSSQGQMEKATLCLMNKERQKRGLNPLKAQSQLREAALQHTLDMLSQLLFSHSGSNGSSVVDRIKKSGYLRGTSEWWVGENIAYGYGATSAPRQIMDMLMHSPEHRANILDKDFEEVGVTVEFGTPEKRFRNEGATYTTDFGARRK